MAKKKDPVVSGTANRAAQWQLKIDGIKKSHDTYADGVAQQQLLLKALGPFAGKYGIDLEKLTDKSRKMFEQVVSKAKKEGKKNGI